VIGVPKSIVRLFDELKRRSAAAWPVGMGTLDLSVIRRMDPFLTSTRLNTEYLTSL